MPSAMSRFDTKAEHGREPERARYQASIFLMTLPLTSVRRKLRPWWK
jgi:hypothetical protein